MRPLEEAIAQREALCRAAIRAALADGKVRMALAAPVTPLTGRVWWPALAPLSSDERRQVLEHLRNHLGNHLAEQPPVKE